MMKQLNNITKEMNENEQYHHNQITKCIQKTVKHLKWSFLSEIAGD